MKLARYEVADGNVHLGVVQSECVHQIERLTGAAVEDVLHLGSDALAAAGADALRSSAPVPLRSVKLLAPIARPPKFLALGGNYASHLKEIAHLGVSFPDVQIWCNKQSTCVTGPYDDVHLPADSNQVDYEGELAVVIGKRCRHVSVGGARDVVAGFMVCNDVSARDVQLRSPTMTLGKSYDTHGPIGPWLVTSDEIPDPHQLVIRTWVNGELRQDGNTSEMRYSIFDQIAELTRIFTLEPGDILATGTPAGIAAAMRPPKFLRADDVVRVEVVGIGAIQNRFVSLDNAPAR